MKPYKVILCGSRNYPFPEKIEEVVEDLLNEHGEDLMVIHGGAWGADTMAETAALKLGIPVVEVMAQWGAYRRSAGPRRNIWMLALEPHEVIGFHHNIAESKGTRHMLRIAEEAGVKTRLVSDHA